ncbi:MAG: IclR family transcriptional regulator [Pigmentiphaga sp.]|uniref:IclR family transcriptional regulator n=1 Tax=Pigmentiphaga sp. TaxID=1977564 RepID=UPI0029AC0694|nr:IclR family transcriptional regulator [Pigmentiphaga sp.]MDX3906430.1 IclR family transcriptional regulator [Pigmentiphaga sp.]
MPADLPATSLEKMLYILDLVEDSDGGQTYEELSDKLGLTRSTLYRYLKVLTDAGLLTSLPDVGYTLGPRISELDYKMRMRDPLIIASRPVMIELVKAVPGIALLCRKYKDKVLCVHQESNTDAFNSSYERGYARPLLRGSASRIILAFSPARTVGRLYAADPAAFADAGLGDTLEAVKAKLAAIRQRGWDSTSGQVTHGVTGIAAPIMDSHGNVVGSLSVTIGRPRLDPQETAAAADRIVFCAGIVSKTIASDSPRARDLALRAAPARTHASRTRQDD